MFVIAIPIIYVATYGTVQFKLDITWMWLGLDMIHFSFYMCACMHVHARLMRSNLLFKALVYALNLCMTVC